VFGIGGSQRWVSQPRAARPASFHHSPYNPPHPAQSPIHYITLCWQLPHLQLCGSIPISCHPSPQSSSLLGIAAKVHSSHCRTSEAPRPVVYDISNLINEAGSRSAEGLSALPDIPCSQCQWPHGVTHSTASSPTALRQRQDGVLRVDVQNSAWRKSAREVRLIFYTRCLGGVAAVIC